MNSAAQVDQLVENWKKSSFSTAELVVKTAEAELGWPYVWGAVGAQCTPSKREYYAGRSVCPDGEKAQIRKTCRVLSGKASACDGCEYYPNNARVLIDDCQGFCKQVFSRFGIKLAGGGATTMYKSSTNWTRKGPISEMPLGTVCCVFMKGSGDTMSHVGIHIGGGQIIHCSGTVKRGKTTDRGWTHYGIPVGIEGDTPMPWRTTIRKGSRGDDVRYCQELLLKIGYDVGKSGADGIFGTATLAAVKKFQGDYSIVHPDKALKVDGVVGPMSWQALEDAAGGTEPGSGLYTVTIKHLDLTQATALCNAYPGATKEEEGD